jgi:hypothetical protein
MTFWKRPNWRDRKQVCCQRLGEKVTTKSHKEIWGLIELSYAANVVVVAQLYVIVKTHRTVREND